MTFKSKEYFYSAMLFVVAFIWGSGFIATQIALDANFSSAFIMVCRFTIASLILLLLFNKKLKDINKDDIRGGSIAGVFLFMSFTFQTYGLMYTSPSSNAFLTATNVVLVPFFSWALFKTRPQTKVFVSAIMCLIGVSILSVDFNEGLSSFGLGEILTLCGAVSFACHTMALGKYSKTMDINKLVFLQLLTASILSLMLFLLVDRDVSQFVPVKSHLAIFYLAIFSTCIAYFLQTASQRYVSESTTAVIISTESLFASFLSVMLGFEVMTYNLILGGILILLSVVIAEVDFSKKQQN